MMLLLLVPTPVPVSSPVFNPCSGFDATSRFSSGPDPRYDSYVDSNLCSCFSSSSYPGFRTHSRPHVGAGHP